jgi:hypothetical protein
MDLQVFLQKLSTLGEMYANREYEAAYDLVVDLLEEAPYSADLLVKRARLEQLLDTPRDDVSPDSARSHLQVAQQLQPDAVEPLLELAHLTYAVQDDPEAGLRYFQAALDRADTTLREALFGKIKCLLELRELALAEAEIEAASGYFGSDVDIQELETELHELRASGSDMQAG